MTRLIAIGDTHIHQGPRNDIRLQSLARIVDAARALTDVGAIVWAGDLFHARSTVEDRLQLADFVQRLGAVAPVVICRGNHDGVGELEIFSRLRAKHPVYVVTRPETIRIALATGGHASIAVLPYPDKSMLVGAGVGHSDLVQTADALFDAIFMRFAHELAQARDAGDLTWFMGHVNIAGATLSSGQPSIGRELEIRQVHLERLGPVLKIANHIHLPQEVGGAIYPGSIAPMDWGETHECSVVLVEMRDSFDFTTGRQSLGTPPLYLVEGHLSRDIFWLAEGAGADVERRYYACDWAGCDVRCQYSYLESERPLIDEQVIRDLFASALRLKVQGILVPDREVRSVKVATATTYADKLAAMRPDGVLPASLADKATALEQQDRDQVLAGVRAWLQDVEQIAREEVAA